MKPLNYIATFVIGFAAATILMIAIDAKPNNEKYTALSQEYMKLYLKSNDEFLSSYRNHISKDSLKLINQKSDLYFEFYEKTRP